MSNDDGNWDEPPVELDPLTGEPIPAESLPPSHGPGFLPGIGGTVTEYGDDGPVPEEEAISGDEPEPSSAIGDAGASATGPGLARTALITAAAVVVAGAIGVGVWSAKGGDDGDRRDGASAPATADGVTQDDATTSAEGEPDTSLGADDSDPGEQQDAEPASADADDASTSTAASDSPTEPLLGWEWFVISRNTTGHQDLRTKFHTYAVIYLEFADDQDLDEQHPVYRVTAAQIVSPDPQQTDGVNCTYSGPFASAEYDASMFIESPKAGFVRFDLTDPNTLAYEGQLISVEGPSQIVTQTCPNETDSRDHGRGPHSWLDTSRFPDGMSTVMSSDHEKDAWLIADGVRSGDAGYTDLAWFLASCRGQTEPTCDELSTWTGEKLLEGAERTVEAFLAGEAWTSSALVGTGARLDDGS